MKPGEKDPLLDKPRKDGTAVPSANRLLAFMYLIAATVCITIGSTLAALEFSDPSSTRYISISVPYTFAQGISVAAAGEAGLFFTHPNFPYPLSNPLSNTTFIIGYTLSVVAVSPVMLNTIFTLFAGVVYIFKSCAKAVLIKDRWFYSSSIAWVGLKTVAVMVCGVSSVTNIPLFVASELAISGLFRSRGLVTIGFAYAFQWLAIIAFALSSLAWALVILPDVIIMLALLGAFDLVRFVEFGFDTKLHEHVTLLLELAVICTVSFMCFFALRESYPVDTIFG